MHFCCAVGVVVFGISYLLAAVIFCSSILPAFKHIVRFSIGVSSSYYLNKHLSIQLEALYSEHGSRYNENFVFYSMYGHVKYTYVQAPLLLKYHFGPEALRFNVYAGPHYWQGVGNVETLHHFRSNTDVNKKSFEDANIYNFDLGITGGLGVSVPAFGGNIIGEFRYQYGLTDFVKSDDISSSNRNFQLLIGYAFLF